MKKVFHFVKSNNFSGLENVVLNIIRMVKGYNYTYVSPSGPIDKELKSLGINHITIPDMNPISVNKVIKKYSPDIVHAHDPKASVSLSFSSYYCKKNNIKMISQLHNDDPRMSKKFGIISILYAFSSLFFSKIISVSNSIISNYAFSKLINKKSVVISNIINIKEIKNNLNSMAVKKWDIAFLGRISYQKNPLKFINIVKYLKKRNKNIRAVVIGKGDLLDNMKDLSRKYNVYYNIDFLGFKSNPYKYLQQSKILVITSRFEGFCLVALEALSMGIPVISTPLKVVENIVDNSCGSFAKSNEEFSNKIYDTINDDNVYYEKSDYAKQKTRKINNINTFIKLYKEVYH